jgi:hypothetical protein
MSMALKAIEWDRLRPDENGKVIINTLDVGNLFNRNKAIITQSWPSAGYAFTARPKHDLEELCRFLAKGFVTGTQQDACRARKQRARDLLRSLEQGANSSGHLYSARDELAQSSGELPELADHDEEILGTSEEGLTGAVQRLRTLEKTLARDIHLGIGDLDLVAQKYKLWTSTIELLRKAESDAIDIQKKSGQVVDLADMVRMYSATISPAVTIIKSIPRNWAETLSGMTNKFEIEELLEREIDKALSEVSTLRIGEDEEEGEDDAL